MVDKICSRCGAEKPIEDFRVKRGQCLSCEKEYRRDYRLRNKERFREYNRLYLMEWAKSNRERKRQMNKEYYKNNTEKIKAYFKQYKEDNPIKRRLWSLKYKNLKKRTTVGKIKEIDIDNLLSIQDGRCFYCDSTLGEYQIEHIIPLSKGGEHRLYNIVLACEHCNKTKSNKCPEEFVNEILLAS